VELRASFPGFTPFFMSEQTERQKNAAAVALGRLGAGKPRRLTEEDKARRRLSLVKARAVWIETRRKIREEEKKTLAAAADSNVRFNPEDQKENL